MYLVYNSNTMYDVTIYGNSATYGGGLYLYASTVSMDCTGGEGGVYTNSASYGGGAYATTGSSLSVTSCDWGKGDTDNSPEDLYMQASRKTYADYGADASFTCSATSGYCE